MNIIVADFERDYAAIRGVRFAVFVDEQQIPRELVNALHQRAADPAAAHVR